MQRNKEFGLFTKPSALKNKKKGDPGSIKTTLRFPFLSSDHMTFFYREKQSNYSSRSSDFWINLLVAPSRIIILQWLSGLTQK